VVHLIALRTPHADNRHKNGPVLYAAESVHLWPGVPGTTMENIDGPRKDIQAIDPRADTYIGAQHTGKEAPSSS
jgi:hypothetical protein